MSTITFKLPTGRGKNRDKQLIEFGRALVALQRRITFKLSPRGWCYQLEGFKLITKNRFNRVESLINELRKRGGLSIDFVAEEEARNFSGVEIPETITPIQYLKKYLEHTLVCENWYTPDWWENEKYYIQMIVEKIDLKSLFLPVCEQYHIPIATTRGWSSMLQRAKYSRRFKEAEAKGLKCVLLYCGDHDPDGLRISDRLRSNLWDLSVIRWSDGVRGYNPKSLIIDRFGLNFDFIERMDLLWIDNLITASGKSLASPSHPNHHLDYVQDYLQKYGARKCEANALVTIQAEAENLCRKTIEGYLGTHAIQRFTEIKTKITDEVKAFRDKTNLNETIEEVIDTIDAEEKRI